uniref:Importin N-terminal domain-containing protein n=1 Tax=Strigamia maritima TaxID=126957 RepID=T1JET4_STRMM
MINKKMNILHVLEKSLSDDEVQALDALIILQQNSQSNWKEFMMKLSNILSQRWNTPEARKAAGIQFCRELTATEGEKQQDEFNERWMNLHKDIRQWIKDNIIGSIGAESGNPCPAVLCAVSIATVEFGYDEWPELIKVMIQNITSCKSSRTLQEASLQCISVLSRDITGKGRRLLVENSNLILKAIWIGLKDSKPKVIIAAIDGLKNSIELFCTNFENESERELIIHVLCEVAQSSYVPLKIAVFQCFTCIAEYRYQHIEKYMDPQIFAIATDALKYDDKEVRLEVIAFLREICAIEVELKKNTLVSDRKSARNVIFTNKALTNLMPIFMGVLTRYVKWSEKNTDEVANRMDMTWDMYVTFLKQLVHCCKHSNVSKFIVDFGMKNIDKSEWKYRNAAVSALTAVITVEADLIENIFPVFLQLMLQDAHVKVRASAAYAVTKLCSSGHVKTLIANQVLLPALVMGLNDSNEVAVSVCESIGCLALADVEMQSEYFEEIVEKLVDLINRSNGSNRLHKNAACALFFVAGEDRMKGHFAIHKVALAIMHNFRPEAWDNDPTDSLTFLHLSLENLMKHVTSDTVFQICHMIFAVLIISKTSAQLDSQVVAVLLTLVREMGDSFIQYFEPFKTFILTLIERNVKDGVDLIAEICSAVGDKITLYCEEIVKLLIAKLGNKNVSLSAKSQIILVLADLIETIGPVFKIYVDFTIKCIVALQMEVDDMHVENTDFLHLQTELHRCLLKVYSSILHILDGEEATRAVIYQSLLPCIVTIVDTVTDVVTKCNNYLDNFIPRCIEEINDVCSLLDPTVSHVVNTKAIWMLLSMAKNSDSDEIKVMASLVENKMKSFNIVDVTNGPKNILLRGLNFVFKTFSTETLSMKKDRKNKAVVNVKLLKDEMKISALCSSKPKELIDSEWQGYVLKLSKILSKKTIRPEFRQMAATRLRNALTAEDGCLFQMKYDNRWFSFNSRSRQHIKENILKSLGTETINPTPAALCVVSIAAAEFPNGQWPDLMKNLVTNIIDAHSSEAIKEASFQTISCLCQELGSDGRHILLKNSNAIFKAIILGMKDTNIEVVVAAVSAMENAADLFWFNLQVNSDRYTLIQTLYEIAEITDDNVRIAVIQCLKSLLSHHHEKLVDSVDPTFFEIAMKCLLSDSKEVRLKTIDFFKEVCYVEDELRDKMIQASHRFQDAGHYEHENRFYTGTALSYLLPTFMELLAKYVTVNNDSDCDVTQNDIWNKYLGFLKELISCCGSNVGHYIMTFIKENITNCDWRYRNAALVAFNTIIRNSQKDFEPLVLPLIQIMVEDENIEVRASAAHAISEMCTDVLQKAKYQHVLIPALLDGLCDGSKVAAVACNAISNLAFAGKWNQSKYFVVVVQLLLAIIIRSDADNRLQWEAAYTLHFIVGKNIKRCFFAARETVIKIIFILKKFSNAQECQDHLSILHITLEAFLKRLPLKVASQISTLVMESLTRLIKSKFEFLIEVNLLPLISTLIKKKNVAAIRMIRDLCQIVGRRITPYCSDVVPLFIIILKDSNINRGIKKEILSAITYIVLAIGRHFDEYLDSTLTALILLQGQLDEAHVGDHNLYVLIEMHKHLLKSYRAISHVFKSDPDKTAVILKRLEKSLVNIVEIIKLIVQNQYKQLEMYLRLCVEVLHDISRIIDSKMSKLVDCESIVLLLSIGSQSSSREIRSLSALVNKQIDLLKKSSEPLPPEVPLQPQQCESSTRKKRSSLFRIGLKFIYLITGFSLVGRFFRQKKIKNNGKM